MRPSPTGCSVADIAGRRGAAVVEAVLDGTLTLVAERGYAFSVEEVAAHVGVNKTTVYRRWPTKAALVADAMSRFAEQQVPAPSASRDPVAALTALALQVAAALRTPAGSRALRAVAAAVGEDDSLTDVAAAFFDARFALATPLIERGVAEGRLREGVDATWLWAAMVNPLHMRAILGRPATDQEAKSLVQLVLDGAHGLGPDTR